MLVLMIVIGLFMELFVKIIKIKLEFLGLLKVIIKIEFIYKFKMDIRKKMQMEFDKILSISEKWRVYTEIPRVMKLVLTTPVNLLLQTSNKTIKISNK